MVLFAFAVQVGQAQVKARSQTFSIQPPARPASLTATVEFSEPSGNGYLDAGEKGAISVTVSNSGGTAAKNVVARIRADGSTPGLEFADRVAIGEIAPNASGTGKIDVTALGTVQRKLLKFTVEVVADNNVKADAKSLTFSTLSAATPAALAAAVEFTEPSGNKVLDGGEKGIIKVVVTNSGGSVAKNVVAKLSSATPIVGLDFAKSATVGDIAPGSSGTGLFELSALEYIQNQNVALTVDVSADQGVKAELKSITVTTRAAVKPAALAMTIQFSEPSGNGALDPGETGTVAVSIANSGGSLARGVTVRAKTQVAVSGVTFPAVVQVGDIAPNASGTARISVQASETVRSQTISLIVEAADAGGVSAEPKTVAITTRERVLARDTAPPDIEVWEPVVTASRGVKIIPSDSKFATQSSSVIVRGIAKDTSGVAVVTINGQEARLSTKAEGFEFVGEALLVLGENDIEVRALDRYKNENKLIFRVTRNPETLTERRQIPAALFKGQRWAVIVGISRYRSTDIPQLRYADRDAQEFYNVMTKPIEEGGVGVPKSNVRFLLNDQASSMNVREALTDFLKLAIEDDYVFIYFAGHGAPDPDRPKILYLLTHDSDLNRLAATSVKMQEIQDALRDYVAAKTVLVFADACHSRGVTGGVATRALAPPELVNDFLSELARARASTMTFSASDVNQLSQEDKRWGGGHGVFTHYLLEGLQGKADLNSDQMVRLGELTQYVSDNVRRDTKSQQSPISSGNFDINLPLTIVTEGQSPEKR